MPLLLKYEVWLIIEWVEIPHSEQEADNSDAASGTKWLLIMGTEIDKYLLESSILSIINTHECYQYFHYLIYDINNTLKEATVNVL